MKVAVYAEYVGDQCYDVFGENGSKSRSEMLSGRVQEVSDAHDFGGKPHFSPETTQKIIDPRNALMGMCFDKVGERGHTGRSMDLIKTYPDVTDVLDKLVTFELSDAEIEEADADWDHESQFYQAVE